MRYWIKLYTEILSDPKMGRLTDRQFRTCINLFALAGQVDDAGRLPPIADIAWSLRMAEAELQADLETLAALNILSVSDAGWLIVNWRERQGKPPSAAPERVLQRVQDHRARQRNETVTALHDDVKRDVTPPEQNRIDTEENTERDESLTPAPVVARASVTRTTVRANRRLSPQVNLFAKITGSFPPKQIHHLIDAAIDARNDEAFLRTCYEQWLARGFRKENIAWLTDWYQSGSIPERIAANGRTTTPGSALATLKAREPRQYDQLSAAELAAAQAEWDAAPTGAQLSQAGHVS